MSLQALRIAKLQKEFIRDGFERSFVVDEFYFLGDSGVTLSAASLTALTDDFLVGNSLANTLNGGRGDDYLRGGGGGDNLRGGEGFDTAVYVGAASGVTVSLANASLNTGDAQGDVFTSIENVMGTGYDDTIFGDANANFLEGLNGNDVISGGAGMRLGFSLIAPGQLTRVAALLAAGRIGARLMEQLAATAGGPTHRV